MDIRTLNLRIEDSKAHHGHITLSHDEALDLVEQLGRGQEYKRRLFAFLYGADDPEDWKLKYRKQLQFFLRNIRTICRSFSSPTKGQGSVHGDEGGMIIYDSQWEFINSEIISRLKEIEG